jgi:hypothetical protein
MIERLRPPRTPRPILIERLGPLQPPVSPLALGPLGQRSLPLYR